MRFLERSLSGSDVHRAPGAHGSHRRSGAYALTTGIDRDRQRSAVVPIAVVDADLVFAVSRSRKD